MDNHHIHTLICVTFPSCCTESKSFGGKSLVEFSSSEVSPHNSKALSCNTESVNYNGVPLSLH